MLLHYLANFFDSHTALSLYKYTQLLTYLRCAPRKVRRILVRGVNAPLPHEAKKILKI